MKRYYDQLEQLAKGSERQEKENKKVESKDRPLDGFLAIFSDARQMHKYINSYPYDKISKYIPQLKAR